MAIAAAVVLPLGVLFILSGLVVNFIQAIIFVLVRPISKTLYRRINKEVVEILWLQPVWLFDWWANIKVELYADQETYELMGCLGNALAVIKKSLSYIPVLGWSMWFSGYIILERRWAKDENTLKAGFKDLNHFPRPFWLALFPEGTRFTQAKLRAAQEYAVSAGLPIPKNVLIPRTKGFVSAVHQLRSFVPAIYNVTIAIPEPEASPTMLRILKGHSSVVHVHIDRYLMQDLPETGSEISRWCRDIFVAKKFKDALLEQHLTTGAFPNKQCHENVRTKKSLLVVITFSCLVLYGAVKLFEWCTYSWTEATFCAVFLVVVVMFMQILIYASQSERSDPAQETKGDGLRENLLPK